MQIKNIPLAAGQNFTVYNVSDGAMTNRQEIKLVTVLAEPIFRPDYVNSTRGRWRLGKFKLVGKRTEYHLDVRVEGTLIVPGIWHGVPADHERWSTFAMSATLNLAAEPARIRELVGANLNPNFSQHDRIIAYPEPPCSSNPGRSGILVYPDAPTEHAVIERMRSDNKASK